VRPALILGVKKHFGSSFLHFFVTLTYGTRSLSYLRRRFNPPGSHLAATVSWQQKIPNALNPTHSNAHFPPRLRSWLSAPNHDLCASLYLRTDWLKSTALFTHTTAFSGHSHCCPRTFPRLGCLPQEKMVQLMRSPITLKIDGVAPEAIALTTRC
jgi:hypothetical protein